MPEKLKAFLQSITGPWTWQNLRGWLLLIGGILFIKGCVVDQYAIPSASMEPTLHGDPRFLRGDRVVVNKWVFGPRIPFTSIRLWDWAPPKRWDIVVFRNPDPASDQKILIKRIAGLPGERIALEWGQLIVNGEVVPFPDSMPPWRLPQEPLDAWVGQSAYYLNNIDLAGLLQRDITDQQRGRVMAQLQQMPYKYGVQREDEFSLVPPDHYLLLGDNSLESKDGRIFGWVHRDALYGRAAGIWWPLPRRRDFTGFSHTWWGMALIYGIPTALIAFEIWRHFRNKRAQTV